MTTRLGLELSPNGARAVLMETDAGRMRWHGAVEAPGSPARLASALAEAAEGRLAEADEVAVALASSPAAVYQPLRLPPLTGDELREVAENELRRETGAEGLESLTVRAWRFGEDAGDAPNTLAVGVPESEIGDGLALVDELEIAPVSLTTPAVALHRGLSAAGRVPSGSVTGIAHLGDQFGFVVYVEGDAWILLHHFPVTEGGGRADAGELMREVKQSFVFLRSRAPGASLRSFLLSGPGLPGDDLALRVEESIPDVEVRSFAFEGHLDMEGVPYAGAFLEQQPAYAVPLLLAAGGTRLPVDFLPISYRLPRARREALRGGAVAGAVGAALVAAHAGLAWAGAAGAADREERAEAQLERLRPRVERMQRQERLRAEATATGHLVALSRQQRLLTPAALRELSRRVPDAVVVDSLVAGSPSSEYALTLRGRSTGSTASAARESLNRWLAGLRGSPLFLEAAVRRQQMERTSDGEFRVNFTLEARLLGQPAGDGAGRGRR